MCREPSRRESEVTKVKSAYYTVQNVATLFDATIEPAGSDMKVSVVEKAPGLVTYAFRQKGTEIPLLAFWDASNHPTNDNTVRRTTLKLSGAAFQEPVWIDMVTGAIYAVPSRICLSYGKGALLEDVPYYDAPVVITERKLVMKD